MGEDILEQTRKALFEVFGKQIAYSEEMADILIRRHTFCGDEDPGEWSPGAAVVIHCESIPLPEPVDIPAIEAWSRVSDLLEGHFCEHINNVVVAVYKV